MRSYIIRLQKTGRWRKPIYNIVVTFKDAPVGGFFLEKLGFYSPVSQPKYFFVNFFRLSAWLMRGATLSSTVGGLVGKMIVPSNKRN